MKAVRKDKKDRRNTDSVSTYSIGSLHNEKQLWSDRYYQKKTKKDKLNN